MSIGLGYLTTLGGAFSFDEIVGRIGLTFR
jgi:hypothetical protein